MSTPTHSSSSFQNWRQQLQPLTVACVLVVLAVLIWCYGAELARLSVRWLDPDYHHGFLAIPFAVYLAWNRRKMVQGYKVSGSLWGVPFILLAVAMQCVSAYMTDPILTPLSLLPCLAGIALLMGGWRVLHWLAPCLAILVFMIPLPDFLDSWGNLTLQRISTVLSTFVLQTLGVPAAAFGNVIMFSNVELGVEEACSGLRSTMLFLAFGCGAAVLIEGTPERIVVLLSAAPAAIIANVVRIVFTGLMYQYGSPELAEAVFHDFFGLLMLPLAVGMVWLSVRLTRLVFVPVEEEKPIHLGPLSTT